MIEIADNASDLWKTVIHNSHGGDGEIKSIQDSLCFCTGLSSSPFFNGVIFKKRDNTNLHREILIKIKNYFAVKNVSFVLYFAHNEAMSGKLNDDLQRFGFLPQKASLGITAAIDTINSLPISNKIDVKKVTTSIEYLQFMAIFKQVFKLTEKIKEDYSSLYHYSVNDKTLKHYVGYYENEPVATLTSYISGTTVGLYNATTLANSLGKGLCLSLTQTAISEAKKSGCKVVIAQLDPPYHAFNLGQKLGFTRCCTISPYVYLNPLDKSRSNYPFSKKF